MHAPNPAKIMVIYEKKNSSRIHCLWFSTELPSLCWRIKERITSCTYLSEHHIALHRNRAVKSMFVMKITQKYIVFLP